MKDEKLNERRFIYDKEDQEFFTINQSKPEFEHAFKHGKFGNFIDADLPEDRKDYLIILSRMLGNLNGQIEKEKKEVVEAIEKKYYEHRSYLEMCVKQKEAINYLEKSGFTVSENPKKSTQET